MMVLVAALVLGAAPPEPSAWKTDERGRRMRVGFDPGNRWLLEGGLAASGDGAVDGELRFGLSIRQMLDFPGEGVAWKMHHQVLEARWSPGGDWSATLYQGRYHRWMEDGWVMLPTSPPRRLPFPLNIGIEGLVGRFETRPLDPEVFGVLAIQQAQVVFDFWRSPRVSSFALVGLGPSWDVRLGPQTVHRVAPLSRATLDVHHEWDRGRQLLHVGGEVAYAWSDTGDWQLRARATGRYEVTVLAINDWPVSLAADIRYRFEGTHHVRGLLALSLTAPLSTGY